MVQSNEDHESPPAHGPRFVLQLPDFSDPEPCIKNKNMTESPPLSLKDLQSLIRNMYGAKDVARGVDGTFMWLMEEVGELAAALREGTPEELALEFADVLAWLATKSCNIPGASTC